MTSKNYFEKEDIQKGINIWQEQVQLFLNDTIERKIIKNLLTQPMSELELSNNLNIELVEITKSLKILTEYGLVKRSGSYSLTSVGEMFALFSTENLIDLQEALFNAAKKLNEPN